MGTVGLPERLGVSQRCSIDGSWAPHHDDLINQVWDVKLLRQGSCIATPKQTSQKPENIKVDIIEVPETLKTFFGGCCIMEQQMLYFSDPKTRTIQDVFMERRIMFRLALLDKINLYFLVLCFQVPFL